jgi:site-specific DNA-methyltransferase (adenine-specific)
MENYPSLQQTLLLAARQVVLTALQTHGVAILPPTDVKNSLRLIKLLGLNTKSMILDPWYNKGIGEIRDDYIEYILDILSAAKMISEHIFLWGFPEIVARFVERVPPPLYLVCWLTWYYKNSPSVIRGWRSSQMACLHLAHPGAKLYPEHFLNEIQKQKWEQGKLRYIPGPTSVIEEPLLVGFVGKEEQTGHPAQKPVAVFQKLLLMTTKKGELVLDPMSGSGTTGEAARRSGRLAIISDHSEEYTQIAEKRLGIKRINIPDELKFQLNSIGDGLISYQQEYLSPATNNSTHQEPNESDQLSLYKG